MRGEAPAVPGTRQAMRRGRAAARPRGGPAVAFALAAVLLWLPVDSAALADEPADRWDRYRVIAERNIFSPERQPPASVAGNRPAAAAAAEQEARESQPAREPDPPGARFTLVGVSTVGERPFAFFEDADTGQIITARIGQVLADRALTAITLDSVRHAPVAAREAEPDTTEVGQTLAGEVRRAGGAPRAARPASARPDGPAASESRDRQVQSILEALRREREQELNP